MNKQRAQAKEQPYPKVDFKSESKESLKYIKKCLDATVKKKAAKGSEAKENKNEDAGLRIELGIYEDSYLAMEKLLTDKSISELWKKAEDKYGELYVRIVSFEVQEIYRSYHYRPNIPQKKRDRELEKIKTKIQKIVKYTSTSSQVGLILEQIFSKILSTELCPERRNFYAEAECGNHPQLNLIGNIIIKMKLQLDCLNQSRNYSNAGTVIKLPVGVRFSDIHTSLIKYLDALKEFTTPGNMLGPFLQAVSEVVLSPKFKIRGTLDETMQYQESYETISFNETMGEFLKVIQVLQDGSKFYEYRNTADEKSKEKDVARGYANLVKKIYGKRNIDVIDKIRAIVPRCNLDVDVISLFRKTRKSDSKSVG